MPAGAQELEDSRVLEKLAALNRLPPLRSSEFDLGREVIGRKIIDRKNKVVGEIKDVIIDSNGNVGTYLVSFDRLKIGGQGVYISAGELKMGDFTKRYTINMNDAELEAVLPTMLANTQSAAGPESGLQSIRRLTDADVLVEDGRRLGKVQNILFAENGKKARGLYVAFTHSAIGQKQAAVPFSMVSFAEKDGKPVIMMDKASAAALIDFTKRK